MLKILNLEPSNYSEDAKNVLKDFCELVEFNSNYNDLPDLLKDIDGVIVRLGFKLDKLFLDQAPKLKFIATATTGLNHIDNNECIKRGINLISLKGEIDFLDTVTATAEHSLGLMLALVRNIPEAFNDVKEGNWERSKFKGIELSGRTIGIIGFGRLGKMVANYAISLRMKVIATDTDTDVSKKYNEVTFLSLNELLEQADIISIHVPLDNSTTNLISKQQFKQMKKKPYLINTSRGEVLDEKELLNHLNSGYISGAAIDVINNEVNWSGKIPNNNNIYKHINKETNLIVTPHIGGATSDSILKTELFIAKKISILYAHKQN